MQVSEYSVDFGYIWGTSMPSLSGEDDVAHKHLKVRLQILLPLIFAGIHLIAMGGTLLTGGENGDGALGIVLWNWPVFVLCKLSIVGRYICSFTPRGWVVFVLTGALIYAFIGLVIGTLADRIRAVIARRWG